MYADTAVHEKSILNGVHTCYHMTKTARLCSRISGSEAVLHYTLFSSVGLLLVAVNKHASSPF